MEVGSATIWEGECPEEANVDFAFESTLSGRGYVSRLNDWKGRGYRIEIIYLTLPSPEVALHRIESRGPTRRARACSEPNEKRPVNTGLQNTPEWIRTTGLWFRRPTLYPG